VPFSLLQTIAELPEEALHRGLDHLQAAELLYETRLFPEREFTFKHALTHEVAYGGLLQERRHVLHGRIVEVLESLATERLAEQVERLAYHAMRGELWEKAVTYCQQGGARAHYRGAFREARAFFEQALQALTHLSEDGDTRGRAIDLRLALVGSLAVLGDFGRRLALLREAEALARRLDDRPRLVEALARIGQVHRQAGDNDSALSVGREALALATGFGNGAAQVQAAYFLGQTYYDVGDFSQAAELQRWNVEVADRESGTPSTYLRSQTRARLARTLGTLGVFAEGQHHGEEALRLATLVGRGQPLLQAYAYLGSLYLTQGNLEHAIQMLEKSLALCRTSGNRIDVQVIAASLGFAYALQGRLAEGRALLEEAVSESIRTGALRVNAYRVAWLSEVCRLAGRGEEAWQHARWALDHARQLKERGNEAIALHQLGVVQAHADPLDATQAEAYYQQALALAEELGMRPLQAHCHLGLGMLYATTGQHGQARAALSAAIELYRGMEMQFWLPQAEATLAQVQ
jgi:tetratricopeptide (TPR) repeat protein